MITGQWRYADVSFFCRVRIDLTPSTSYQRLLVHRCSAYYRLSPEADASTKNIIVYYRTESRMYVAVIVPVVALWLMHSSQVLFDVYAS